VIVGPEFGCRHDRPLAFNDVHWERQAKTVPDRKSAAASSHRNPGRWLATADARCLIGRSMPEYSAAD
jgi:hypothetical protein